MAQPYTKHTHMSHYSNPCYLATIMVKSLEQSTTRFRPWYMLSRACTLSIARLTAITLAALRSVSNAVSYMSCNLATSLRPFGKLMPQTNAIVCNPLDPFTPSQQNTRKPTNPHRCFNRSIHTIRIGAGSSNHSLRLTGTRLAGWVNFDQHHSTFEIVTPIIQHPSPVTAFSDPRQGQNKLGGSYPESFGCFITAAYT